MRRSHRDQDAITMRWVTPPIVRDRVSTTVQFVTLVHAKKLGYRVSLCNRECEDDRTQQMGLD